MDTKKRILFSALQLFSEYGFEAVSMRQIADSVGIRSGSIYNHYDGKSEILEELGDYYFEGSMKYEPTAQELDDLIRNGTPRQVILRFAYDFAPEDTELMLQLNRLTHLEQYHNQKLREVMLSHMEYKKETMANCLVRLAELGKIPPCQYDVWALCSTFVRSLVMIGMEASLLPERMEQLGRDKREMFEALICIAERGLGPPMEGQTRPAGERDDAIPAWN